MPDGNPASVDIASCGGCVVEPSEAGVKAGVTWLSELVNDPTALTAIGVRTRALAEQKFDVQAVSRHFNAVLAATQVDGAERARSARTRSSVG